MYCLGIIGPVIFDYNKWLIIFSVIRLSGAGTLTQNLICNTFDQPNVQNFGPDVEEKDEIFDPKFRIRKQFKVLDEKVKKLQSGLF